jgi:Glycosyl transferase family 2
MAVYNGERHVQEAIDSILTQTFTDFEFVIVNDGSTDKTRELLSSFRDPRIRLIENAQNQGLTKSLNRGFTVTQGDYVARQDADDISEPERLAKQVNYLEKHHEVALLGSWYRKIDDFGHIIGELQLPCDTNVLRWYLLFYCPFVHSAMILRKQLVVEQIGLYNESFIYSQDYDLWCRIASRFPVANLDEYLVRYRITSVSMTSTYGAKVRDEPFSIARSYLSLVCSCDALRLIPDESSYTTLTSFVAGSKMNLLDEDTTQSVDTLTSLHARFCRYYGLQGVTREAHRAQAFTHVITAIMAEVYKALEKDNYAKARHCLVQACRLHSPAWLIRQHSRLLIKYLLGSTLTKALRRIAQRLS